MHNLHIIYKVTRFNYYLTPILSQFTHTHDYNRSNYLLLQYTSPSKKKLDHINGCFSLHRLFTGFFPGQNCNRKKSTAFWHTIPNIPFFTVHTGYNFMSFVQILYFSPLVINSPHVLDKLAVT